jgi:hypothetical protein
MVSNVIQFPIRAVREWIILERSFRGILERSGASPEMMEEVCARMKEAQEKFDCEFKLALELPPLPEGLKTIIDGAMQKATKELADQVHEYTNQLRLDRLQMEIQLYKLRHEEPEKA